MRNLIKEGIKVALHSDMPMAPASPSMLMHAAINRDNFAGKVAGPDQRISSIEALRAVTINAAYVLRLEKMYGSIEVGKYANFTILDKIGSDFPAKKEKVICLKPNNF